MPAGIVIAVALLPLAVWRSSRRSAMCSPGSWKSPPSRACPRARFGSDALLFLVPAHDEELLIGRCVGSLKAMDFPAERREIVVIADNCSDRTAALAAAQGARVLERSSARERGKGHAIGWALDRLDSAGLPRS